MKEFFNFLKENDLTPNGHYVLYCMVNNLPIENVNYIYEQYKLFLSDYVSEEKDVVGNICYIPTKKAEHIVHESDVYICNLKVTKKVNKISFEDWEEKIKEYNEIFPKGKKSGSIAFRTNPKELYDKFKWFFAEYPEYTWDNVITATKMYAQEFESSCDYTYMQTSKYFIKKDDKNKVTTSTLATVCYNIAEGNTDNISSGTYYFGP